MSGDRWIAEGQRLACLLILAATDDEGMPRLVREETTGDPTTLVRRWAAAAAYLATLSGRDLLGPQGALSEHRALLTETVLNELERLNAELGLAPLVGLVPDYPDFES